jgi:hypothetical protein
MASLRATAWRVAEHSGGGGGGEAPVCSCWLPRQPELCTETLKHEVSE